MELQKSIFKTEEKARTLWSQAFNQEVESSIYRKDKEPDF